MSYRFLQAAVCGVVFMCTAGAAPQDSGPCPGCAGGCRCGPQGRRQDASFTRDRADFHYLLEHRAVIARQVDMRDDGVVTVTESTDPAVVERLQRHVQAMVERVKDGRPIHRRDPLFAALFDHAANITTVVEPTEQGVRVVSTSEDPFVVQLIQAHARVVSLFVKNGFDEVHRDHGVPAEAYELPPCWRYGLGQHEDGVQYSDDDTQTVSRYCCALCDMEPCRLQQGRHRARRGPGYGGR